MKKLLFLLSAVCIFTFAHAQEGEKRPLSATEYDAVKKIVVQNLEKDTYVKAVPFVLDRSQPPFVFKFSDGNVRKVYLFKLYESEKLAELGMVAIYTTAKEGKKIIVPIPSPDAPGEVWGKYIDDLKYGEKDNMGLASCLAFAITKSGVGGNTAKPGKEGDKYEYCFPAEATVTLADGSQKEISEMRNGDKVLAYNSVTSQMEVSTVKQLQVHNSQSFTLTHLALIDPVEKLTAGPAHWHLTTLEATANHPVLTATGKKNIGDVTVGETLYQLENGKIKVYEVFVKNAVSRQVPQVYNLVTDKATYVVNGVVVFGK